MTRTAYPWVSRGDLSGFWALFADNLANMIIIASVLVSVVDLPAEIVFGRVLPGLGVSLMLGLGFYGWLAGRLARSEDRTDVTALPYGISTPVLFVYLFGVMVPVAGRSDPVTAWQVGIAAAFVGGLIEMVGSVAGPWLKRHLPRAAMLGTLAGIAMVYIATVPLAEVFEKPLIGFAAMAVVLVGLVASRGLPLGLPPGLVAIVVGVILGFVTGDARIGVEHVGWYLPVPVVGDLVAGLGHLAGEPALLAIVLPVEIYNFIETMNNVESAEAAGDRYPVHGCQLADGVGTAIGALFGAAFPTTVYIGHPGYKRLGAGRGYALGVGLVFFIGSLFGLVAFLDKLIPVAAVAPILVYIGIVITGQAFTASPRAHAMAVAIAMIPHVSNIIVTKSRSLVTAMGSLGMDTSSAFGPAFAEAARKSGFHWRGQAALSQGAILAGMIWGALSAFLIDGRYAHAALCAVAAAVLVLPGLLHGDAGWPAAAGYALMAAAFAGLWVWERVKGGGQGPARPREGR